MPDQEKDENDDVGSLPQTLSEEGPGVPLHRLCQQALVFLPIRPNTYFTKEESALFTSAGAAKMQSAVRELCLQVAILNTSQAVLAKFRSKLSAVTSCKDCGGSAICGHGRQRSSCKDCGGSGICQHKRRRNLCKECGGSAICEHGRRRCRCKECGREKEQAAEAGTAAAEGGATAATQAAADGAATAAAWGDATAATQAAAGEGATATTQAAVDEAATAAAKEGTTAATKTATTQAAATQEPAITAAQPTNATETLEKPSVAFPA